MERTPIFDSICLTYPVIPLAIFDSPILVENIDVTIRDREVFYSYKGVKFNTPIIFPNVIG